MSPRQPDRKAECLMEPIYAHVNCDKPATDIHNLVGPYGGSYATCEEHSSLAARLLADAEPLIYVDDIGDVETTPGWEGTTCEIEALLEEYGMWRPGKGELRCPDGHGELVVVERRSVWWEVDMRDGKLALSGEPQVREVVDERRFLRCVHEQDGEVCGQVMRLDRSVEIVEAGGED